MVIYGQSETISLVSVQRNNAQLWQPSSEQLLSLHIQLDQNEQSKAMNISQLYFLLQSFAQTGRGLFGLLIGQWYCSEVMAEVVAVDCN